MSGKAKLKAGAARPPAAPAPQARIKPLSGTELKRRLTQKRKQHKAGAAPEAAPTPQTQLDTLTVEEVAVRLRIGRNQAYEAVHERIIPSIKIGGRWLIPRAAFERLMRGEILGSVA